LGVHVVEIGEEEIKVAKDCKRKKERTIAK